VCCWALKSAATDKIVAWLFDDDFSKTQDANWGQPAQNCPRTYANDQADNKKDHTVNIVGATANRTYKVQWYNTWDGGNYYRTENVTADANGNLKVPVGVLARTASSPDDAWDGADVILVIE